MSEQPAIKGVLPCEECGNPHDAYRVDGRPDIAPHWAAKDGHHYRPVADRNGVLTRLIERGVVTTTQVMEAVE